MSDDALTAMYAMLVGVLGSVPKGSRYVGSKYYVEFYDKKSYVTNKEVDIDIKILGIVGL